MYYLTPQERRAVVFLACIWLVGLGVAVCARAFPRADLVGITEHSAKININAVTYDELMRTRLFSKTAARNIIDYRSAHGCFQDISQLDEVKGLGQRRLKRLRELCFAGSP